MKRTALALTLILALLFSAVAGIGFVNLVFANPWIHMLDPSPPVNAKISIFSPKNATAYSPNLPLNFNVSFVNSTNVWVTIWGIYYKTSWETDNKTVYLNPDLGYFMIREYSYEENFTNVPEGKQNLTITVTAHGSYHRDKEIIYYHFFINESTAVDFTIAEEPKPEPFPVIPIATASGVSIAAVGVGLLFYFKKRKRVTV